MTCVILFFVIQQIRLSAMSLTVSKPSFAQISSCKKEVLTLFCTPHPSCMVVILHCYASVVASQYILSPPKCISTCIFCHVSHFSKMRRALLEKELQKRDLKPEIPM